MTPIQIPYIQLRTNIAICYNQYHDSPPRNNKNSALISARLMSSDAFRQNVDNLKEHVKYTGMMTAGAKKRLSKCISLLVTSTPYRYQLNRVTGKTMKFKLSFITLTLAQSEKSKDAKFCHKNLLEPTLRYLRRSHGMKSYVWKCELQKNGSIHYHVTSDCFVPHTDLRNYWNQLASKHGLLEDFKKKYGHENPNSIDVHATKDIRNLEAYLIKYVAKEHQNEQSINAKIWDASLNLKQGKYYRTEIDSKLLDIIHRTLEDKAVSSTQLDKCLVIKFPSWDYIHHYFKHLMEDFKSHNKAIRQWVRQEKQQIEKECRKLQQDIKTSLTWSQGYLFHMHNDGSITYTT